MYYANNDLLIIWLLTYVYDKLPNSLPATLYYKFIYMTGYLIDNLTYIY